MNVLDDKLDYILKSNAAVQRHFDKHAEADYDKLIPQIKQAIAKEQIKEVLSNPVEMTGQEWYNRFEKELEKYNLGILPTTKFFNRAKVLQAAKRAAGLENQNNQTQTGATKHDTPA